ncbi:NAD(P)H-dependent oxidoreductase [Streptomyces sp. NPDC051976]|uniref:NADPH-dependent FMN reductase n=1 Tax=Streptomyces sp. NPDC051976 TaxID=3154947 RepID=UPI00341E2BD8
MPTTPIKLAVIVGSTREGRFAPVVANWFTGHARQRDDVIVDVIDLAEHRLPVVLPTFGADLATEDAEALAAVSVRLSDADAFAVVTPEYNHSFPASLKNLIDWHHQQWHAKPVGFVSYGGLAGGLRAVEHLRQVFAELHAVTVRDTVSFHGAWTRFDPDGHPNDPEGCAGAAKTMLDQLTWWARVLRDAKAVTPYHA